MNFRVTLYFNVACLTQRVIKKLSCGALQVAGVAQRQRQFDLCCRLMGGGLAPPLFILLPLVWGALVRCKPIQNYVQLPGIVRDKSFLANVCLPCEALDDVFEDSRTISHAVSCNLFYTLWHGTSHIINMHTWTYEIMSLKHHGNTSH